MQAPLWGFWDWAWCVYMVSDVSAVMTNRCVLLLVPAVYCIGGRRVHSHTRPQTFEQISVRVQNHILCCFSPLLLLIKGVWSPHAKQTPCLLLFWPLTHPCPGIKRYLTRTKYFSLPKCGLWLRFSFGHHVRGGYDRYKPFKKPLG